jgi:hypothetical protein
MVAVHCRGPASGSIRRRCHHTCARRSRRSCCSTRRSTTPRRCDDHVATPISPASGVVIVANVVATPASGVRVVDALVEAGLTNHHPSWPSVSKACWLAPQPRNIEVNTRDHCEDRNRTPPPRPESAPPSLRQQRGRDAQHERSDRRRRGPAVPPHLRRQEVEHRVGDIAGPMHTGKDDPECGIDREAPPRPSRVILDDKHRLGPSRFVRRRECALACLSIRRRRAPEAEGSGPWFPRRARYRSARGRPTARRNRIPG